MGRWRVIPLGAVLVLVILSAPGGQALGVAPMQLAGVWVCTPGFDVRGFQPSGVYYPLTHPDRPPFDVPPAGCFRDEAQAESAGYRLAPPPPGDSAIDGVYLAPTTAEDWSLCQRAANRLAFAVPCPSLLPVGLIPISCPGFQSNGIDCAWIGHVSSFTYSSTFTAPDDYTGPRPGEGHLNIVSTQVRAATEVSAGGDLSAVLCPGTTHVEPGPSLAGQQTTWVVCPDGSGQDSGHVALAWQLNGIAYEVSLHGHGRINRDLDKLIAQHLQFVSPST
jgi:hypothetical protein